MDGHISRRGTFSGLLLLTLIFGAAWPAFAEIDGGTNFTLNLLDVKEAAKRATWSDPEKITATPDGIGWGTPAEKGSRDFWLETSESIGIGLSWRPTSIASIKATVERTGTAGMLYVRYSADAEHWSTWQLLESQKENQEATQRFMGELRIPYRERARYDELRMEYARREDVAWNSDEEALARDILQNDPEFFKKNIPFIGFVQFLYEGQLPAGARVKKLDVQVNWFVGGKHHPPKNAKTQENRDVPWRFTP